MKYITPLSFFLLLLGGCTAIGPTAVWEDGTLLEPLVVFPSFSNNYLMSCLSETESLDRKEFTAQFEVAEQRLQSGHDMDALRFVCLSFNNLADYKQFKEGVRVLDKYFADHPNLGEDMYGVRVLVERIDEEILNRWSAWKSLLNDKKELTAEVESLKVRVAEQQKQIEQLKNIEPILKSREAGKP